MADSKSPFTRRDFLTRVSVGGIGLSAGLVAESAHALTHTLSPHDSWPSTFHPESTRPPHDPRLAPKAGEKVHEFEISLDITVHEILPGIRIHAFTYNGTYPGPEIRVPEGDWVSAKFTNLTAEFHTIHWHGLMLPNEMDGVPNGTQWGVGPNQSFTYVFRAQPGGTHFYHCHNMTNLHVQAGMFGALIIEPKVDPIQKTFPYTREYTLCLSEVDTIWLEQQMEAMTREMSVMQKMNENPSAMKEMNGRMMGWFMNRELLVQAVKDGYVPPYSPSRAGLVKMPNFNFFMINGKSYPMTDEILIKTGETIRVRLINAGMMPHFMHLHGHDFWQVAQDGSPLASPIRLNTLPVFPGSTADIIIQGTNPGYWHFHDHSDYATTNNGQFPGGMMTMLMYEDAKDHGVNVPEIIQVSS